MINMHKQNNEKISYRVGSLDGLRAIACLGIISMHVRANLTICMSPFISRNNFISFAGNFVLLFMMISAFSLCCGYLQKFHQNSISLEAFYKRRFSRILPFFAFLTFIDLVKCLFENHFVFNDSIVGELWESFANVTLMFGLLPGNGINVVGVGWFVGAIFLFYLLFPFYSTLLMSKKRVQFAFIISIIWSFAITTYFTPVKGAFSARSCFLLEAPYFIAGGILFLYMPNLNRLFKGKSLRIITKSVVITYTIIFFSFPNLRFDFSNLLLYALWIVYAISDLNSTFSRTLLNNRVMSFISGISLEMYLSHMMLFRIVEKIHLERMIGDGDIVYCLTLILVLCSTIVFSLCWKKIEKKLPICINVVENTLVKLRAS